MALLDVSEILGDPDFSDDLTVVRSIRIMDQHGRAIDNPGYFYTYGNVQPSPQASLMLLPEAERVGEFISIVTPFRLIPLSDTTAPDQVLWQDRSYRVKNVRDWMNYGTGFVEAICELTELTDSGPP